MEKNKFDYLNLKINSKINFQNNIIIDKLNNKKFNKKDINTIKNHYILLYNQKLKKLKYDKELLRKMKLVLKKYKENKDLKEKENKYNNKKVCTSRKYRQIINIKSLKNINMSLNTIDKNKFEKKR